jgi:peptide/nickel transport system substrate-binding protein
MKSLKTEAIPKLEELRMGVSQLDGLRWFLFLFFVVLMSVGTIGILSKLNSKFLVTIPTTGGSLTEGMIGNPSQINPVLALTNTDKDIVSLVFSGLMKKDSNGDIVPDLAESYIVSEDGKTYTFTLKENLKFHNGDPVTSEDVRYTISLITNPTIRSPRRANWEGVNVEVIDERNIKFTLKEEFTGFLENTTIGILPNEIVREIDPSSFSQHNFNQKPIGAGPFKLTSVSKTNSGLIESINLRSFNKYALGRPYLNEINLKFYGGEDELIKALKTRLVDRGGPISPEGTKELQNVNVETSQLPRIFGLFFNQSKSKALEDSDVRKAIDVGINRELLIKNVFNGFAVVNRSPYPKMINQETPEDTAVEILEKSGWKLAEDGIRQKTNGKEIIRLQFKIATGDNKELRETALEVKRQLKTLGMEVEVESFELGILNQQIIEERNYEALLFGELIPRPENLYAFWHSSQKDFPGLNITGYVNGKADQSLITLLSEYDQEKRDEALNNFINEIAKDRPAVFLYSPMLLIGDKTEIQKPDTTFGVLQERFVEANKWYTKTDKVWSVFIKNI